MQNIWLAARPHARHNGCKILVQGLIKVVYSVSEPLKFFCDNSLAVIFSKDNKVIRQSKFMDIKYLIGRERVRNKEVFMVN